MQGENKMNGRAVVLGAKGMLGSDLMAELFGAGVAAVGYDLPELNIADTAAVEQAIHNAGVIINCAAYTNVEKAESEKDVAFRVNGEAVGKLGRLAKMKNVPVLHISTDFVFDGTLDRPYRETDIANPVSAYGASKYAGEKALAASGCGACIVRVQWTYGKNGVNFIKKLLDAAKAGKPLRVVDDQTGSPTATTEVAQILCRMIQLPTFPQGVYHLAAGGYVSRYEMARFLFDSLKMNVDLSACKTSDFPSAAKRPLNSCFDCTKLEKTLNIKIDPWQTMLTNYLETL
jgi:dTDP-4-dehydrorhamnose reductase